MSRPSHQQLVIDAMPGTTLEITEAAGVQQGTVVRWVRIMRAAGECHISGWIRSPAGEGGPIKAIYALGAGEDAKCKLRALTNKDYSRRYRRKAKEEGRYEFIQAKKRADYYSKKAARLGTSGPLMAALFGRTPAPSRTVVAK
jgi:hypothetical protein